MQVQFSKDNLDTLLNAKDKEIDGIVKEWCEKQKPIDNLYLLVYKTEIEKDKVEKLVKGVFAFLEYYNEVDYYHVGHVFHVIENIINRGWYSKEDFNKQLINWFKERIIHNYDMTRQSQIFSLLRYHRSLIQDNTIEQLLRDIIDSYFEKHVEASILDLKKPIDFKIISCLYNLPDELKRITVDCLIKCCSNASTKPTINRFMATPEGIPCVFGALDNAIKEKLKLIEDNCCSDGKNVTKKEEKN